MKLSSEIKLTLDQQIALDSMLNWADNSSLKKKDLFFLLNGFAGTGKSFISKLLLDNMNIKNVVVTAPTHKAKKVIARFTNREAKTIQSLLGLRPDVNMEFFNINNPVFNPLAIETIKDYRMVVIDEGSMLNRDAFNLIVKKAIEYRIKILFMGDILQLPPINEIVSRVFTHVKRKAELSTIVRQHKNNPNTHILELIRYDIKNNKSTMLKYLHKHSTNINKKGEGFLCLNPNDFSIALTRKFCTTESIYDSNYIKYLSFTNKSVSVTCNGIRKKRIGKDHKKLLVVGELLTGYNTISEELVKGRFTTLIENSEDYTVTSISPTMSDFGISCLTVTMKTDENQFTTVNVVNKDGYKDFLNIFRNKLSKAMSKRGRYWVEYYKFKHSHLLMEDFYRPNSKIEVKKDLYYSYGSTVHKSQGSTYSNSAVNINNISKPYIDIKNRNKLLYVALSRTSGFNLITL